MHRFGIIVFVGWVSVGVHCTAICAGEGFVTATFGNTDNGRYPKTLQVEKDLLRFDVSALPRKAKIVRAILRFPFRSDWGHHSAVRLIPVGVSQKPLPTAGPAHRTLDATEAVRAWVADPSRNTGLKIMNAASAARSEGRSAEFRKAVLEVSYIGDVSRSPPIVSGLKAEHRRGQTVLTWKEPWDVVGKDNPKFEEFEEAVPGARGRREVVYRVYRHRQWITPLNLGEAELVREVPEALSCWNLLAIANTEHAQPGVTKHSPLRGGNLRLKHVMTRYRIDGDAPPLARAIGLAVLTAAEPRRYYYAVTVAVNGQVTAAQLKTGENLTGAVREQPARFPAIVYQRTREPRSEQSSASPVDVYVCWLAPLQKALPRFDRCCKRIKC